MKNENPQTKAKRFIGCGALVFLWIAPLAAFAEESPAPSAKPPPQITKTPLKERNGAELRPVAIRLEGTWSFHTSYSVGITGGYAFNRWFALEGTLGWEGGWMSGAMGRLRIPVTPSSSLSVGVGATGLWVPWNGEHNNPGTYLWFPGELGYEYREKEGFTFLIGVGARLLAHAQRDLPDAGFDLCIICLEDPPMVFPAGRFGIGWAF